jgi:heptosyltransferase-3
MVRKILIFRVGQLGDSLVALPAVHAIRNHYSQAELYLLYDQHIGKNYVVSRALFEGSGFFQGFIGYPIGYGFKYKVKSFLNLCLLCLRLRREKFDLVIHLEPEMKTKKRSFRDRFFFRLGHVKKQIQTVKYRQPRNISTHIHPTEHESDFFLRTLSEHGISVPPPGKGCMDINIGLKDEEEFQQWLKMSRIERGRVLVGIGVGSKMQAKRWPLERFKEITMRMVDEHNVFPIFFGGSEDFESAQEIIEFCKIGSNACGSLSLRGAIRALAECELYVGNDTGTMHMAVAAGIRCVVVFSARDVPGKWYPYGDGHIVHREIVACEGCMLYECHVQARLCLTRIQAKDVFRSCASILTAKVEND